MWIFISYRRDDSSGHAGRLYDGLVAQFGEDAVFMDVEDIPAGSSFRFDVERGSGGSEVVLVVIGRGWASIADEHGVRRLLRDDDVLRLEVRTALEGPARVIPVLVDGAAMPASDRLPPDLRPLCELNAVELTHRRWAADLVALVAEIREANRPPKVGDTVGGYRIEAVIREARHGTVCRAGDLAGGRGVILRVITGAMARDEATRARLLGLERRLAGVDHPCLAKPLATGLDGQRLFIATPLLDGDTLRRVLARRGRLPLAHAVRIVQDAAEGLAAAHAQGLAHGSVKSSNILLIDGAGRQRAAVIDFQLSVGDESPTPLRDVAELGRVLAEAIPGAEGAQGELPAPWRGIFETAVAGGYQTAGELAEALRAAAEGAGLGSATQLGERFTSAVSYARSVHEGDVRKATEVPYIAHLMAVCALVLGDLGSEEEAIAGLLHDAAEDHGGEERLAEIEQLFGAEVARIVRGCSDTLSSPKPPWKERKIGYIEHLRTATDAELRVALADKLDNARALADDLGRDGAATWARFNMTDPAEQLWYYRTLAELFLERRPGAHAGALDRVVRRIEALAAELASRG